MATKSILKNIDIKDNASCFALVDALEKAEGKRGKKVVLSKPCTELKGEALKKVFGSSKEKRL